MGVGGIGVVVGGMFVFVAMDSGVNVAIGGTLVFVAVGETGVFVGTAPFVQTVILQLLRDPPSAAV